MKRILHIDLGSDYGGAEKVVEKIYKYIDRSKYEIKIVCLNNSLFHKSLVANSDFNSRDIITVSKKNIFKSIKIIKKILSENSIDCIHSHGILSNLYAYISNRKNNITMVYTVHSKALYDRNMSVKAKILQKLEIFLCNKNSINLCVSQDILKYMLEQGVAKDKLKVLYNGVERIEKKGHRRKIFKNNYKTLCCIGRLTAVKGQDYILELIYKLKKDNIFINCIFAGDGEDKEKLESKVKELNLEEQVVFLGFVIDITEVFCASDIFIMTSKMEGLPIALLEAIQYGIPVIVPNIGGIPEVINESNGTIFRSENIEELQNKVKKVIEDDVVTKNKSLKAMNDFKLLWSIEVFIYKLQNIYDEMLKYSKI